MDMTTGPVPVYRALKKSTPQLIKHQRQDLVDDLRLRKNHILPDTPTGMSTTLSKDCLGPHVDNLTRHRPPVVAHQRACNNLSRPPRTATVGARLSPSRLHSRTGHAQQTSTTVSMYCNWRISVVSEPGESATAPRRENRQPTKNCNCGTTTVAAPSNHAPRELTQTRNHCRLNTECFRKGSPRKLRITVLFRRRDEKSSCQTRGAIRSQDI